MKLTASPVPAEGRIEHDLICLKMLIDIAALAALKLRQRRAPFRRIRRVAQDVHIDRCPMPKLPDLNHITGPFHRIHPPTITIELIPIRALRNPTPLIALTVLARHAASIP